MYLVGENLRVHCHNDNDQISKNFNFDFWLISSLRSHRPRLKGINLLFVINN